LFEFSVLVSFCFSEDEDELPPEEDLGVEYDLVSPDVAGGGDVTGVAFPEETRIFSEGGGREPVEWEDGPIALGTDNVRLPGVLSLSLPPEEPLPAEGT